MSTGDNNTSSIDVVYGSTMDRNDPFSSEIHETTKFIGGGTVCKFDFQTIKAANVSNSKRSNRYELSKSELLHMLCYLEGELQARDVVIAALRNERVKQYIHAMRVKRVNLDDPQAALFRDKTAFSGNNVSRQSSAAAVQSDFELRSVIEQQIESLQQVINRQRQTQARMIAFLSDSLENNQRMRQELEEEKRKHEHDTAQGDDITYGLEMERTKLKQELDTEKNLRKKLEKDLKKSQEILDFEKGRQKQIVLLLLAERKKIIMKYIEERKRSEDLAQILSEEKQRSDSIAEGLEEESKKSLRMEAELEKQALAIENERKTWKQNYAKEEKRVKDMELEITQLRNENEAFRKQLTLRVSGATPVIVGGPGSTLSNKVRSGSFIAGNMVPEDVAAAAVAPSSIMNVAKIIQPTATVSSVPVSGPTTGIARSISSGQCLRQQATAGCNDLILGGPVNVGGHVSATAGAPPASLGKTVATQLQSTLAGEHVPIVASNTKFPHTLSATSSLISTNSHSSTLASAGAMSATAALGATQHNQQTATIHRAGTSNATLVSTPVTATLMGPIPPPAIGSNMIANATANMGRGLPPPIPPNKPTVPPKREPSISRISTAISGVSSSAISLGSTSATTIIQPSGTPVNNTGAVILSGGSSPVTPAVTNSAP